MNHVTGDPALIPSNWQTEQLAIAAEALHADDAGFDASAVRFVGGTDISFVKGDGSDDACACIAVCDVSLPRCPVVWSEQRMVAMEQPYVAGYLAFREVEPLQAVWRAMRRRHAAAQNAGRGAECPLPELLLVDGNGVLHPRAAGLAVHLGVVLDVPCFGVAKNLHEGDGLERRGVHERFAKKCHSAGDSIKLVGESGRLWGAAVKSTDGAAREVFASCGHRLSLESGLELLKRCSLYRVPEPIRQADLISRASVRSWEEREGKTGLSPPKAAANVTASASALDSSSASTATAYGTPLVRNDDSRLDQSFSSRNVSMSSQSSGGLGESRYGTPGSVFDAGEQSDAEFRRSGKRISEFEARQQQASRYGSPASLERQLFVPPSPASGLKSPTTMAEAFNSVTLSSDFLARRMAMDSDEESDGSGDGEGGGKSGGGGSDEDFEEEWFGALFTSERQVKRFGSILAPRQKLETGQVRRETAQQLFSNRLK